MPDIILAMNHFKLCESKESPGESQNGISYKLVGKKPERIKGQKDQRYIGPLEFTHCPRRDQGCVHCPEKQPLNFNPTVQVPC